MIWGFHAVSVYSDDMPASCVTKSARGACSEASVPAAIVYSVEAPKATKSLSQVPAGGIRFANLRAGFAL